MLKQEQNHIEVSTYHTKNLNLSTWKSRPVIVKFQALITKISDIHNKYLEEKKVFDIIHNDWY